MISYDRFDFALDLLNHVWSMEVYSDLKMSSKVLVSGQKFGAPLANLTELQWHVGYGNEKSFFDQSSFAIRDAQIPEPGSYAMLGLGGLLLWGAQSRRKSASSCPP